MNPLHQKNSLRESDDGYGRVVAVLNNRWRVITCHQGCQWILQRKDAAALNGWRGDAFCQTRRALLRIVDERGVEVTHTSRDALRCLPSHIHDSKVQEPSLALHQHSEEVSDA